MKHTATLMALVFTTILLGCSSMKVTSEKAAQFDFSAVRTYEWVQAPEEIMNQDDTLLDASLQQALNNELAARGWKQTLETSEADIQVVYYIKLCEQERYSEPPSSEEASMTGGFTFNRNTETWGYRNNEPDLNVYSVEIGTLSLLFYDAKTGEKVWTGSLQTKLERSAPIEKQRERIRLVAHKITEAAR